MTTTTLAPALEALYKARRGRVDVVDVPGMAFVVVAGRGDPEGADFMAAMQALYAVSYGAHFLLKKSAGQAPRVMPLEAQWWVDDAGHQRSVEAVAQGEGTMADTDRDSWRWQAMIMQPDPIDAAVVAEAVEQVRTKDLAALDRVTFLEWEEGRCAQLLHVGPYAEEAPSLRALHEGIAAGGLRPRGRHHELYLGDPRRSAPERLRTILRQPVESA